MCNNRANLQQPSIFGIVVLWDMKFRFLPGGKKFGSPFPLPHPTKMYPFFVEEMRNQISEKQSNVYDMHIK